MNKLFPIGSVYITFLNMYPPYHGAGLTWEALQEGYALMTANSSNSDQKSGNNRVDSGSTVLHTLTID